MQTWISSELPKKVLVSLPDTEYQDTIVIVFCKLNISLFSPNNLPVIFCAYFDVLPSFRAVLGCIWIYPPLSQHPYTHKPVYPNTFVIAPLYIPTTTRVLVYRQLRLPIQQCVSWNVAVHSFLYYLSNNMSNAILNSINSIPKLTWLKEVLSYIGVVMLQPKESCWFWDCTDVILCNENQKTNLDDQILG